jgi:NitT/TauT family transport system substrate-binding protein
MRLMFLRLRARIHIRIGIAVAVMLLGPAAFADDTIRVVAQKTGTFAWELNVARAHGLDKQAQLTVETLELANPEAGKVALRGGSADIVVSDWTWVSRERTLGARLTFYPYSSALGAIMVSPTSSIRNLTDLHGKTLAVAGGPIDKSWLFLRAALMREGLNLQSDAKIVYGAPTLLAEKTAAGEFEATLNYWNICVGLEVRGLRRLAEIADLLPKLGIEGRPAMIGYVFDEQWAVQHRDALTRFLDVSRKAKEILATSDAEWERIAPLVGTSDPATLKLYRERYREGIPRRPIAQDEADARTLYGVLAELGGPTLVGPAKELAPGTFYQPQPAN